MRESYAGADPPELDWERWRSILQQFAAATGLVVSVYDDQLRRRIGPLLVSRLGRELSASGLWAAEGPGAVLERNLAARSMASERLETDTFCTELVVRAMPLPIFGAIRGAIVFGWVYCSFPTVLANDCIARALGITASRLWSQVRLESPISPIRVATFCELLQTLVAANIHQTEALEELQALSRMREILLAQVSHDLRTPLAAIALRIEALLLGTLEDPVQVRNALKSMQASVREEARLVEDLIDAARSRTGQLTISRADIELETVLRAAVAAIEPQAQQKGLVLNAKGLDTGADTHIWADGKRLQQVFWNLLSNAVKFTPPMGIVTVGLETAAASFDIYIEDSGIGIDTELLPHVFDSFVKRDAHNENGMGLGMSIAKHIVELHGGSIQALSAGKGEGTTVRVWLPRGSSSEPVGQSGSTMHASAAASNPRAPR